MLNNRQNTTIQIKLYSVLNNFSKHMKNNCFMIDSQITLYLLIYTIEVIVKTFIVYGKNEYNIYFYEEMEMK
jgi:hypothetical protein